MITRDETLSSGSCCVSLGCRRQPAFMHGMAGCKYAIEKGMTVQFINDYLKAIDLIALVAVIGIATASFIRSGFVALLIAAIVVAVWGASRIFGIF